MSIAKKKKRNIYRELIIGSGVFALVFPMMLTAITFSLLGVFTGLTLLLGTTGGATTSAMIIIAVYGASLAIFGSAMVLFFKRFRLLLDRQQAIQAEHMRVVNLLDTTAAEQRLADYDRSTSVDYTDELEPLEQQDRYS